MKQYRMSPLQKMVGEWADQTFPESTPLTTLSHLAGPTGEAQELFDSGDVSEAADCYLLILYYLYKGGYPVESLPAPDFDEMLGMMRLDSDDGRDALWLQTILDICNELPVGYDKYPSHVLMRGIAKVVFLLHLYCIAHGVSICDESFRKHEINLTRKWGKPDEKGVVRHIED